MSWSKHRIFLIVFILLFSVELFAFSQGIICIKPLLLSLFLYSILLALASYFVGMRFYIPMINHLPNTYKGQKYIVLTFDDGPNPNSTKALLELLERHEVKANFFLIGKHIEEHADLAKELHTRGHLLGNHSYSHTGFFPISSTKKLRREIEKTNKLLEAISLKKNTYFRPPFGVTNPLIAKVVKDLNMKTIGWSLRSYDTVKSKTQLIQKLKSNLRDGDIVLMHDIESSLDVVEKFIEYAKENGYQFVLLSEFFEKK
ncbi:MAG: polysaccharide deacetylase family protein [Bacteroidetes bacterium]|nr:MAG: polysaccharide deacetylase family protein [Bacteroidota bacterium]